LRRSSSRSCATLRRPPRRAACATASATERTPQSRQPQSRNEAVVSRHRGLTHRPSCIQASTSRLAASLAS
jgi:hypothetical protein